MADARMQTVPANEIRDRYFGRAAAVRAPAAPSTTSAPADLTPSARYVAAEAKRRLGEARAADNAAPLDEQDIFRLVIHIEESEGEQLSESERTAVVAALSASLDHYDILSPLVENPEINDIIVRAYDDVSVQAGRRNVQTDLRWPDRRAYCAFIENLLKRAGKACTLATPVVDAAIDPDVRACVTHESFSPPGSGPMLTLRIARHQEASLEGLVHYELAPRDVLEYLASLVRDCAATVLIAGEVGTGKTTLVRALASQIDPEEALLVIEDTHEIVLRRPFTRTLLTREANTEGAGRITPAQAIRAGMRMAMNRVILGEMRDAESAESFVDVCASGHAGMSTIHARSARDALGRLELFLLRAQGNVGVDTVRRQIADAISAVVYLGLDPARRARRIMSVLEVGHAADGAVQVSPIFSFVPGSVLPEWRREGGISLFAGQLDRLPAPGTILTLDPEALYRTHVT